MSTRRVTWRVIVSRITSSEASPILSCRLTKAFRGGRERQTDRKQHTHRKTQRHREAEIHSETSEIQKQRDTEIHQTERDIRDVVRHKKNTERHTARVRETDKQRDREITAFWEQGIRTSMV